jgi:alkylated DNA nucleotide flippase Atl1
MASLVARGEWTTYGDISAAVHGGDKSRARMVARAAANDPSFPNAHRVLAHDGSVIRAPDNEAERRRAIRRLRNEGIRFDARRRADRSQRLHWDALRRRAGHRAVRDRRS